MHGALLQGGKKRNNLLANTDQSARRTSEWAGEQRQWSYTGGDRDMQDVSGEAKRAAMNRAAAARDKKRSKHVFIAECQKEHAFPFRCFPSSIY